MTHRTPHPPCINAPVRGAGERASPPFRALATLIGFCKEVSGYFASPHSGCSNHTRQALDAFPSLAESSGLGSPVEPACSSPHGPSVATGPAFTWMWCGASFTEVGKAEQ